METVTVSKFMEENKITAEVSYIGLDKMNGEEREMDKWNVEFMRQIPGKLSDNSDKSFKKMTVDYFTGLGHREDMRGNKMANKPPANKTGRRVLLDEIEERSFKPKAESIKPENVVDCIISDAQGFESAPHFDEWAAENGYDSDSRKAEKIFNAVSHQTRRLKKFLGAKYQAALETERL